MQYYYETGAAFSHIPPLTIIGSISNDLNLTIASDAERSEANSQESFFPQSYGNFKQRDISKTVDFFLYGLCNKRCFFSNI